jgi:hypothetical protein
MSASDLAAWMGLGVASFSVVWQVWREVRSGPRLRVTVSANMQTPPALPDGSWGPKMIAITVYNIGDAGTSITHLIGHLYPDEQRHQMHHMPRVLGVIPGEHAKFPVFLEPGKFWTAWLTQSELEEKVAPGEFLDLGVVHSMNEKPAMAVAKGLAPRAARPQSTGEA